MYHTSYIHHTSYHVYVISCRRNDLFNFTFTIFQTSTSLPYISSPDRKRAWCCGCWWWRPGPTSGNSPVAWALPEARRSVMSTGRIWIMRIILHFRCMLFSIFHVCVEYGVRGSSSSPRCLRNGNHFLPSWLPSTFQSRSAKIPWLLPWRRV